MTVTMDLGVSEAYRHEAETSCEVHEANYEEWERHVWDAIKKAGQYGEARENSLASTEPEADMCPGCGWSKFAEESLCVQCRSEIEEAGQ